MRIAIIGCGSIGTFLARAVATGAAGAAELAAVVDIPAMADTAQRLARALGCRWTTNVSDLAAMDLQMAVEAAGVAAARAHALPLLRLGLDVMLMSAGALADADFRAELRATAAAAGRRVYVPSGAIGGLDAIKAALTGDLTEVTLTTAKPPAGLAGAPYFTEHPMDLAALTEPTVIFEGPAAEAIRHFPANVNVAISLSLAGLGPERTRVRIVADPGLKENVHEVSARGDFGVLMVRTANRPSPANPRTSHLAALSAVALIRRLSDPIQMGT